ncbi:MAG TPA: prephenate dehydrogenase [Abditibacteriaceae bacterium]|nr:prephenate dehydrogenase [Abditibacteriaceae bacterium]
MLFDTICIIGVGLIGGSFGIAVRERHLARQVVGAVRREATINAAFQRGAVDNATTDLAYAVRGADLVLLAAPVAQIKEFCVQLEPLVRGHVVVTDVGSTKAEIVRECTRSLGQKAHFIGGHPMAGSELTGVQNARGSLFENATWVLTPNPDTPTEAVEKLTALVKGVGAKPIVMDPATHDALLAITSHLPHITAAALVQLFASAHENREVTAQLIAGGWRDATRVAAGSPEMWRDICLSNAASISAGIDDLRQQLQSLREMLEQGDADGVQQWFEDASTVRRKHGYLPRSTG